MNVAVLLCAYNGEKYIRAQLDSIASQELKPIVVYVYDWGSTDETVNIVKLFKAETDLTCELIRKDKPIGVAAGFKVGIQELLASSYNFGYIALCDQDDIWLSSKLFEYKQVIDSKSSVDMVFSDVSVINADGEILIESRNNSSPYFTPKLDVFDESVIFANPVVGMTIMVSRKLASTYASSTFDFEFMHDWSLVLICYFMKLDSYYVDKPLVQYRQHSNNILGNQSTKPKIALLLSMPNRIKNIVNQYNAISLNFPNGKEFSYAYYLKKIPNLKVIKPTYKVVLLFFLMWNMIF
ncbi:glycosyltransferase [Aliivibrio fischeri]|uniref:glycosyltransferase n=1 Tax=Aliivibrio fischeri TaxID=668 RepID=UPI0012D99AE8|nr:glycosyltransferase [Aliivibrio fischeri]MUK38119.1 glycosyltransferase [Aliivibrio fischeri]MUL04028.1 glycosyltransferase [Aliivibrio fischeri]